MLWSIDAMVLRRRAFDLSEAFFLNVHRGIVFFLQVKEFPIVADLAFYEGS